jgi:hypothetical protein
MSINAPTSIAVTGDASITISVTFGGSPSAATFVINSNTYKFSDIFDKPAAILNDLQASGGANCTLPQAQFLLTSLQRIIEQYFLQVNQTANLRFSIAIS